MKLVLDRMAQRARNVLSATTSTAYILCLGQGRHGPASYQCDSLWQAQGAIGLVRLALGVTRILGDVTRTRDSYTGSTP